MTETDKNRKSVTYFDVSKKIDEMDEAKHDDDEEVPTKVPRKPIGRKLRENWHIFLKLLEIALCVTCIGLIYEPVALQKVTSGHVTHLGILYTSFSGYILINVVLLSSYVLKERVGFRVSALFSISGAGLNLVSCVLLFSDREHFRTRIFHPHMYLLTLLMVCGFCALANSVVFTVDAILTFRNRKDLGVKE